MTLFEKQDEMAEDILKNYRGKVIAIEKATRAGATFSLLKRACELKQKTVIIAPYIKIFKKTVDKVAECFEEENKPKIARISRNDEICKKLAERLEEKPELRSLPFHIKPRCKKCEYNSPESCSLQEILQSEWDVLGLTYQKLKALSNTKSQIALDLLEKIQDADNLILDEFTTGIIVSAPSFEIDEPHVYLKKEFDYESRFLTNFDEDPIKAMFWNGIGLFGLYTEIEKENLQEGESRVFENFVREDVDTFFEDNNAKCWKIIEDLTLKKKKTKKLAELVQIITAKSFYILKKNGKVTIKPVVNIDNKTASSKYLIDFNKKFYSDDKIIALVDACLPDLDLEKDLEMEIDLFNWGDPLNTNSRQLIVCDSRKISKTDFLFEKKLPAKLVKFIKKASENYSPEQLLVATQGTDMHDEIERRIKHEIKAELFPENIILTYYRSDLSRGTTIDSRQNILILIGGPYLPEEAYEAENMTSKGLDKERKSKFKKSDSKSAFINLIGRIKDPTSSRISVVFARGMTVDEVKYFIEQENVSPPHVLGMFVQPAKAEDFFLTSEIFFNYGVEKWENASLEVPVLVRIINKTKKERKVACGKIKSGSTKIVREIAEKHKETLADYNVKIEYAKNGCSFIYSKN